MQILKVLNSWLYLPDKSYNLNKEIMPLVTITLAAGTLVGMALILTYILGWTNKAFHVDVDPRVDSINNALPGVNCGGCGYIGCNEYAQAIAGSGARVDLCTVGGDNCAEALASIMDVEVETSLPLRPVVHCMATYEDRLGRSEYVGEQSCAAANLVADVQGCIYGCLGFGDCSRVCDYDAINIVDGLATVDYEKCVGCGACSRVCPRNVITIRPFKSDQIFAVVCSNKDMGKNVTKVCKRGCVTCKTCTRHSSLFTIFDNLSTINYDVYDPENLGNVIKATDKCPRNVIRLVGKTDGKERNLPKDGDDSELAVPDFKTTVDDTEWRG